MRRIDQITLDSASAIKERNAGILEMLDAQMSMAAVGRIVGISRERVRQIRRREERRAEG